MRLDYSSLVCALELVVSDLTGRERRVLSGGDRLDLRVFDGFLVRFGLGSEHNETPQNDEEWGEFMARVRCIPVLELLADLWIASLR